ncbi:hypothetical protein TorRG33x02_049860, partial [Trema orientale]
MALSSYPDKWKILTKLRGSLKYPRISRGHGSLAHEGGPLDRDVGFTGFTSFRLNNDFSGLKRELDSPSNFAVSPQ